MTRRTSSEINEGALLEEAKASAPSIDGSAILDAVEAFISRFVSYPSPEARIAHVLWIIHAWRMELWDSTPRLAALSPEPGSGKSRLLEVTEPLVPRAVHAVNTTPAYLFRKVSDENGSPTILYDEVDTVFGAKAKDNEDVRGMLNAGHRRGATAGRCVVRGKTVETEELPAYCAVALAGLDDLPDTIRTRSIIIRMKRRAPNERIEPWRQRQSRSEAEPLARAIESWASTFDSIEVWPEMPPGVEDRNADVWESLLAVADLAGGDWPKKARVAAVTLVTASKEDRGSLGVQLLADLKLVFNGCDRLATDEVIEKLKALPESPWRDLRGKEIDARGLSTRLRKYEVKPKVLRAGEKTFRGYEKSDFLDPWSRYLPAETPKAIEAPQSSDSYVTGVTNETSTETQANIVTGTPDCYVAALPVTHVTDKSDNGQPASASRFTTQVCRQCPKRRPCWSDGVCIECRPETLEVAA